MCVCVDMFLSKYKDHSYFYYAYYAFGNLPTFQNESFQGDATLFIHACYYNTGTPPLTLNDAGFLVS